jgi:hypothetical protein
MTGSQAIAGRTVARCRQDLRRAHKALEHTRLAMRSWLQDRVPQQGGRRYSPRGCRSGDETAVKACSGAKHPGVGEEKEAGMHSDDRSGSLLMDGSGFAVDDSLGWPSLPSLPLPPP